MCISVWNESLVYLSLPFVHPMSNPKEPWKMGLYGVPHTEKREYMQLHGPVYDLMLGGETQIQQTTRCNRVALEDAFYMMLTDRPSPLFSVGGAHCSTTSSSSPSAACIVAKSTTEQDESPLGNASGAFVIMFKVDMMTQVHDKQHINSPWIPLRMDGSGKKETINAMDRKKHSAMSVAIRAAARIQHKAKEGDMGIPEPIATFMSAAQLRGGSQVWFFFLSKFVPEAGLKLCVIIGKFFCSYVCI